MVLDSVNSDKLAPQNAIFLRHFRVGIVDARCLVGEVRDNAQEIIPDSNGYCWTRHVDVAPGVRRRSSLRLGTCPAGSGATRISLRTEARSLRRQRLQLHGVRRRQRLLPSSVFLTLQHAVRPVRSILTSQQSVILPRASRRIPAGDDRRDSPRETRVE